VSGPTPSPPRSWLATAGAHEDLIVESFSQIPSPAVIVR
jgi:hypothetical protein